MTAMRSAPRLHRLLLAGALLLGAIAPTAVLAAAPSGVSASHAWIRVLPGDLPAGGYVTLRNDGDRPAELTGAASSAYASVMLHQSSTSGGTSRMSMLPKLAIPAHGSVTLAPAGYHLMLMHAHAPVRPGDAVAITLSFGDGSTLPVTFRARPANALDDGTQ